MKVLTTLMATLLTTLWLSASVEPYDLVVLEDPTNNTIVFRSTVPVDEKTEMIILDPQGQFAFRQYLAANQFVNKRFSREAMPDGNYTLVFQDAYGKTEVPIEVGQDGVFADIVGATMIAFPMVQLRDQRMLVVKYNNQTGKHVNVRLTNANGQEVFSEKVAGPTIRRSYQLNQLAAGDYVITVSSHNVKNYTAAIALE